MVVYLIEFDVCGEQDTGSTKSKVRSRANNYKTTQKKFVNKEAYAVKVCEQRRSSKASPKTKTFS